MPAGAESRNESAQGSPVGFVLQNDSAQLAPRRGLGDGNLHAILLANGNMRPMFVGKWEPASESVGKWEPAVGPFWKMETCLRFFWKMGTCCPAGTSKSPSKTTCSNLFLEDGNLLLIFLENGNLHPTFLENGNLQPIFVGRWKPAAEFFGK